MRLMKAHRQQGIACDVAQSKQLRQRGCGFLQLMASCKQHLVSCVCMVIVMNPGFVLPARSVCHTLHCTAARRLLAHMRLNRMQSACSSNPCAAVAREYSKATTGSVAACDLFRKAAWSVSHSLAVHCSLLSMQHKMRTEHG